jgi:LysM repeat protein
MADQAPVEENKLTIYPCTIDTQGKVTEEYRSKDSYTVTLNPANYKENKVIRYSRRKTLGGVDDDPAFSRIQSKTLDFQIVIDGTGVVPDQKNQDFETLLRRLNNVIYKYKGDKHEPNHVLVLWGELRFYGRLESMKIDYTLFDPAGKPLRAKVSLSFISFLTPKEAALKKKNSSSDLSHLITVKAGDTLWQLCHRIYGDAGYYQQVARYNNITNFRYLKPGTMLHFPPVR